MVQSRPEPNRVKASLRRLTGSSERAVIEGAGEATDCIGDAARFVETVGLEQLAAAIEATDDPELETTGRDALRAFRRFRRAAAGDATVARDCSTGGSDHFHRGHGTDLSRHDEPPIR